MKRDLCAFSAVIVLLAASAQGHMAQDARTATTVEDEYVRYELLEPSTHSFRVTHDLSVVTPGVTTDRSWAMRKLCVDGSSNSHRTYSSSTAGAALESCGT